MNLKCNKTYCTVEAIDSQILPIS